MSRHFLTAQWRKLAMANYAVSPAILEKYVPAKTELDLWQGTCYVSLVGFMFLDVKLKGTTIPLHKNFEEVNLRFYVKHYDGNEWKRGVVFIKEIVPKPAITIVANTLYGEKYQTMPMRHSWKETEDSLSVEYAWKCGEWNSLAVTAENTPRTLEPGSEAEFITEHYWGYTQHREGKTSEYEVGHPRWDTYNVSSYLINVDYALVYGDEFEFLNHQKPVSVFLAEGSEIFVDPSNTLS